MVFGRELQLILKDDDDRHTHFILGVIKKFTYFTLGEIKKNVLS
jgi:hypothetical protein